MKHLSIVFLPELPSHQDCQRPNDFNRHALNLPHCMPLQIERKPSPNGQGTASRSKSSLQTKLMGCIDNVQASIPLIHPCYDKKDRNVGLPILFKASDLLSKCSLGQVAKQKTCVWLAPQGFQIRVSSSMSINQQISTAKAS